jgi:hypothetical protein
MKKIWVVLYSFFLVFALLGTSYALTLDSVSGVWNSASGGTNISGLNTNEIRWGRPYYGQSQDQKSGLLFEGNAPPSLDFDIDEAFSLGKLTHFNFPIFSGGGAESTTLGIELTFSDPVYSGNFEFTFGIDETPNAPGPPASDDFIAFPESYAKQTFEIGGDFYTLQLLGFGGSFDALIDEFRSPEGGSNSAQLWGQITTPSNPVPEPGTIALLGIGLVGLGIVRRKRVCK